MSGYIGVSPVPQTTQTRDRFVATSGQTTFATSGYTPNYLDVYLNGIKLDTTDYTATNGSDVVLTVGATLNDIIDVVAFSTFEVQGDISASSMTISGTTTLAGASTSADINFGDNDKAIFGAGSDLQIYHSGNNSYINDLGTGGLKLTSDGTGIDMLTSDLQEYLARFNTNGNVTIYYDGSPKLATTSTGIDVTGTVTADDLSVAVTGSTAAYLGGINLGANGTDIVGTISGLALKTDTKTLANFEANNNLRLYEDTGTTAKFFWDASAESLGIGTASPYADTDLHILNSATSTGLELSCGSAESNAIRLFAYDRGTGTNNDLMMRSSNFIVQTNGANERMRIDSSGNLLVGKSGTSFSTDGVEIKNDQIWSTNTSSDCISLNRKTTDGALATFYKDGTTVGSIGSRGTGTASYVSLNSTYGGIGGTSAGDIIFPVSNTGATTDGQKNIGASYARFKDLYLSGGVYLGGTGSANYLDDYEEGTWTPVGDSGFSVQSIVSAQYVKIGRQVTVRCWINTTSGTADVARLGGLPFTVESNGYSTGVLNMGSSLSTVTHPHVRTQPVSGIVQYLKNNDSILLGSEVSASHNIFTLTYFTNE